MVRPVGFEPTKTASYTHRPVLTPDYESGESFANLLTATINYITLLSIVQEINMIMAIFEILFWFVSWTFIIYWIHRISHKLPWVKKFHLEHHRFINFNQNQKSRWELNNLFLYNDNAKSTIDLWITEVIPTLIFSLITGQWWIFLFYYLWAALLQEIIEHDQNFNLFGLTSGQWHLEHHKNYKVNYGLFFPIWDILFNTYKNPQRNQVIDFFFYIKNMLQK